MAESVAERSLGGLDLYFPIHYWLPDFLCRATSIVNVFRSFTNYDVLRPPRWVGLENYARILFEDDKARLAFSNSVIYAAMYVPLSLLVALILALLLNTTAKGMSFFRTAFYLPSITPQVAMGIMWMWILNPRVGIINRMLRAIGLPGQAGLPTPNGSSRASF